MSLCGHEIVLIHYDSENKSETIQQLSLTTAAGAGFSKWK